MIQIELRPEIELELVQQAQARGTTVEDFVAEIVEADTVANRIDSQDGPTQDQIRAVEDMLTFREKHRLTLGGLNVKDMTHEGHKY